MTNISLTDESGDPILINWDNVVHANEVWSVPNYVVEDLNRPRARTFTKTRVRFTDGNSVSVKNRVYEIENKLRGYA